MYDNLGPRFGAALAAFIVLDTFAEYEQLYVLRIRAAIRVPQYCVELCAQHMSSNMCGVFDHHYVLCIQHPAPVWRTLRPTGPETPAAP